MIHWRNRDRIQAEWVNRIFFIKVGLWRDAYLCVCVSICVFLYTCDYMHLCVRVWNIVTFPCHMKTPNMNGRKTRKGEVTSGRFWAKTPMNWSGVGWQPWCSRPDPRCSARAVTYSSTRGVNMEVAFIKGALAGINGWCELCFIVYQTKTSKPPNMGFKT